MKILVVGSGGREHAMCASFIKSPLVDEVIVSPGNDGMRETLSKLRVEKNSTVDINTFLELALREQIDLTVVGPEIALAEGIVDLFQENNLAIVGPSKAASRLESSKAFAKSIMIKNNIPTAAYEEFFDVDSAIQYVEESHYSKMVVKCDGLAQGKGVIVCLNKNEARLAILSLMKESLLGENVEHIIIEEFLEGVEVSAFAICDGESFSFLGTACDHKRLRDGDLGPNTGGMGVFSPAAIFTDEDEEWVSKNVFLKTLEGMKKEGIPFKGVLFAGLMKTNAGWKVLEFNTRFGDPETQVILPLLNEDIIPWMDACSKGELNKLQDKLKRNSPLKKSLKGVHVVMAAYGYPGTEGIAIRSGDEITFSKTFNLSIYDSLFYAGVEKDTTSLKTKGGRILGITSLAETYAFARTEVYKNIAQIHFAGAQYRLDIGKGHM